MRQAPDDVDTDALLAEIGSVIQRLAELRRQEPYKNQLEGYPAAADRLRALAYRLELEALPQAALSGWWWWRRSRGAVGA